MSTQGYIYVTNWDKFQHPDAVRSSNGMPWFKTYTDLLANHDFLDLSGADVKLLVGIWMLTSRSGNGRIKADSKWLCAILKIDWSGRYRGLERLSDAGFIQVLASKAASRVASKPASTEGEEGSNEPSKKEIESDASSARHNGAAASHRKELGAAIAQAREWKLAGDPALEQTITETWPQYAPTIIANLEKETT